MKLPQLPDYEYEELIGEGPCGWVFRCSFEGGREQRAVKVLKSQATNRSLAGSCLRALSEGDVKHPALPQIFHAELSGRPLAYAMPLFGRKTRKGWNSQSLENFCGSLPAEHSLVLIDQMADAMACLHRNGLFHTGLKPSNLFVESLAGDSGADYQLKILDAGQGYIAGLQFLEIGDLGFYASPEQLETGDLTSGKGTKWDVYSFGVVAFRLLTGKLPRMEAKFAEFRKNPDALGRLPAVGYGDLMEGAEHFINALKREPDFEWPDQPQSDKEASRRFVIEKCLTIDPKDRFEDMREVREALIQSDHQLQMNRISLAAQQTHEKTHRKAKRWKTVAGIAAGFFGAALLAAGAMFGLYKIDQNKQAQALLNTKQNAEQREASLQQAMAEVEGRAENVIQQLDQAESAQQQLIGEAKLARQILRQTQANGDRFFELILENRHSDVPGFEQQRSRALLEGKKYYDRLIEVYADAPDFTLSMADAYRYLGEIHRELGDFDEATAAFSDADQRYSDLIEVNQGNLHVTRGMALVKRAQAGLASRNGAPSVALNLFDQSIRLFQTLSEIDTENHGLEATIAIAENYLQMAEEYRRNGDLQNALSAAKASGDTFLRLETSQPVNDRVIGGVAKAFSISGDLLGEQDQSGQAIEFHQRAADVFARAIQLNGANDEYQLGLGRSLGRIGLLTKDQAKLQAAADVLAEVVPNNPYRSSYQRTLAEVFGALSKEQRDGGQAAVAMKLEQQAVNLLKPIMERNPDAVPDDVKFVYAKRLSALAELQGDSEQFDQSREPLNQAIGILNELVQGEGIDPEYRRTLAHARGMAGFACLKAGDKTGAKQHYEVARVEWENYVSQFPNDVQAAEEAKWTKEQLEGLQ
ncbi:MAG: protein kinase [Verrucomicrobiales bacterium]|nr:protein kinase [Verrucomicrobiales bacterium]